LWAATVGLTLVGTAAGYAAGTLGDVGITGPALAIAVLVVGFVWSAALDAAWRAETYASQDLEAGFVGR